MEIAANLSTALLIILSVITTGLALSGKHRDAAIWVGFTASVCGCFWFCAWLQDYLWKQDMESEKSAQALQSDRAWITPYRVNLETPLQLGRMLRLTVYLKNTGKTPAMVSFCPHMVTGQADLPDDLINDRDAPIDRKFLVAPGIDPEESMICHVPLPSILTQENIDAINAGGANVYIIGDITYEDSFGRKGVTGVCYFLKGGEWRGGEMLAYHKGNYAK